MSFSLQAVGATLNQTRQLQVVDRFRDNVGRRALLMSDAFPFLVIGQIKQVVTDYLFIEVETTHINELEGRVMRIHLDAIEVFYVEDGSHRIPAIKTAT